MQSQDFGQCMGLTLRSLTAVEGGPQFSIQPPQWEKPIYYVNTDNTANDKCYYNEFTNSDSRGLPSLTKASQRNVVPTTALNRAYLQSAVAVKPMLLISAIQREGPNFQQ